MSEKKLIRHAPLPFRACGEGDCKCAQIWSLPADAPIATVVSGKYGDEYPAIKIESQGSINEPAVPYMEMIEYGTVDPVCARATIKFIIQACNNYYQMLEALKSIAKENEEYDEMNGCKGSIIERTHETARQASDKAKESPDA